MNNIISTTGKEIEFSLSSTRKITISSENPIEVTNAELTILKDRLGAQITTIDGVISEPSSTEQKPEGGDEQKPESGDEQKPEDEQKSNVEDDLEKHNHSA